MNDGFTDKRSPLAKALGGGIAWKRVRFEKGRLEKVAIGVRFLPLGVIHAAMAASLNFLTNEGQWSDERLYTELGEGVHDGETQMQVLAKALIVPPEDDSAPLTNGTCVALVNSVDELRELLEGDEVGYLYGQFVEFQRERSPVTRAKTVQEVEAFVDALGKGTMPSSRLRACEPGTLLNTAICMASRLLELTRLSSSPTSPSSEPTDGSANSSTSPTLGESETETMTIEVLPASP